MQACQTTPRTFRKLQMLDFAKNNEDHFEGFQDYKIEHEAFGRLILAALARSLFQRI